MTTTLDKATAQANLKVGRARLWAFIDALPPAAFTAKHDPAGWRIQDHLIHLALWEKSFVAMLRREPRFPAMGIDEEWLKSLGNPPNTDDLINDVLFKAHRDKTTAEVLATLRAEQAALDAALDALSDEELQRDFDYFQPHLAPSGASSKPTILRISGYTYEHYDEHIPWMQALL
ncbi:MAG TPA: DinB family protein [Aggregatilineales bacterium]|nr:DinB family protein [Anaerolineales bacterium]HRE48519.1 DinB family protein [Aggregatilineales bacterium]